MSLESNCLGNKASLCSFCESRACEEIPPPLLSLFYSLSRYRKTNTYTRRQFQSLLILPRLSFPTSVALFLQQENGTCKNAHESRHHHPRSSLLSPFSLLCCPPSVWGCLILNSTLLLARDSSPRPELFSSPGLLLAHPWSAQPQSVPGVPNSRVALECPTPDNPSPAPESP